MRMPQRMVIVLIFIVIFALAGFTIYNFYAMQQQQETLVIYTYESLLEWGDNPEAVRDAVFGEFARRYNVNVTVIRFSDARSALLRLIEEKDNPRADIIIGLDDILVLEAINAGVLEPYTPQNLSLIREDLVNALDPDHYVVPYDFGLIALVYDSAYVNSTTYPELPNINFTTLLNKTYRQQLIVEDPTQSSTGLSFLLWQIAVYEKILHKNWTEWWTAIKDDVMVAASWGDAYDAFLNPSIGRHIVVSYGTDGAYSYYFYNSTQYAAVITHEKGPISWLQIEGIGLVKNAKHPELAKLFIEWFLSNEVQQYIALNNWMYPANEHVPLPDAYKYAIDPTNVTIANTLISKEEIESELQTWLRQWLEIMGG